MQTWAWEMRAPAASRTWAGNSSAWTRWACWWGWRCGAECRGDWRALLHYCDASTHPQPNCPSPPTNLPIPDHPCTPLQLFGWELVMTCVLVSVVFAVAVAKPGHGNIGPLAVVRIPPESGAAAHAVVHA